VAAWPDKEPQTAFIEYGNPVKAEFYKITFFFLVVNIVFSIDEKNTFAALNGLKLSF
jgi:hypothetical protein